LPGVKQPDWRKLLALSGTNRSRRGSAGARASVGGLYGGSLGLALATLLPKRGPALVLHPDATESDDLRGDLELFGIASDRILLFPDLDDDERGLLRLGVLERLHRAEAPIVISSQRAAEQPSPSRDALSESRVVLEPGGAGQPGPQELSERLAGEDWRRATLVTAPGEFSSRGDVFDLFPAGFSAPVRLEFFGDDLEGIRRFDPDSQRATESLERVSFPTRMQQVEFCGLLDHFDKSAPVFLVEGDQEQQSVIAGRPGADLDSLAQGAEILRARQVEPVMASAESLTERVREVGESVPRVFFACRNEAEETRVRHLLGDALPKSLVFLTGRLSRSFELSDRQFAVLGYDDLLQHLTRRRPAPKRPRGRALDDFLDLQPGEHVVHLAHGIGVFRGLETIDKRGQPIEHCVVEFRDEVRIYVPVTKIDLLQKYVGSPGARPRLAKVGSTAWSKAKERVKKAVTDLAARLLDVQAMRRRRPGIACPPDDAMQHEFEASFPYEETPDQLDAIEAVKTDMQTARPMDRLLCGDVGYGKTEVAMRAAFRAVVAGKQVAVLVPTTVLAVQHFTTFRERMAGYPVRVEMLSRFKTDKEARVIEEDLKNGGVDIVIGTHRILSKRVQFPDLGLVVIDEEQRFGVEHKEKLKSLRAMVDILTLTATPIPRTLNMALLGLRDISNLTTPPEGRMPVRTEVRPLEKNLIKTWVEREVRRGGQVYFVHNRVQSIYQIDRMIGELVPSARRAVVHGQMPRRELEPAMLAFVAGEIDVLIATTIIESGLDIPNANTLIVDRADRFGLADLHQLRGRVGRGRHKAYALFLLPEAHRSLREIAEKRLRAIEEHSELGAGFRIALKDLELRGAGNILGAEQSGHIAEVGYELYCRLLEDAVRQIKNEPTSEATDTYVDLDVAAALPGDYAGDPALKLGFYRRVASAMSAETLDAIVAELQDRCGPLPKPAWLLVDVARLRVLGQTHGIRRFSLERGGVLQMSMREPEVALPFLRGRLGRSLRQVDDRLVVIAEPVSPPSPKAALEAFLRRLADD